MFWGARNNPRDVVYCLLDIGWSSSDGNAQSERLANPNGFNPEGFVTNPAGVSVYDKGNASSDHTWMVDDGAWEAYVMGTNSRNRRPAGQTTYFGPSGLLAQLITAQTGKEVAIIKPTWPGTPLLSTSASLGPGPWNNISRVIAEQAYIKRAVRDFPAFFPGKRLVLVQVQIWMGETEVGTTQAAVEAGYALLHPFLNRVIHENFTIRQEPLWQVVKLDGYQDAPEAQCNLAWAAITATYPNHHFITAGFGDAMRKMDLTAPQAAPLTKGVDTVTPNAAGGLDDEHPSYLRNIVVANEQLVNLNNAGLLP